MQESTGRTRDSKPWATLRAVLGFGQMFGAALGLGFLLTTGVSDLTQIVVGGTCLLMVISRLLFRGRH